MTKSAIPPKGRSAPVETYLLRMNQKIRQGNDMLSEAAGISQEVTKQLDRLEENYQSKNYHAMEFLAREVSEHALKIGASGLLQLALELQTLARCQDDASIPLAIKSLEVELHRVQQYFSKDAV